MLDQVKSGDTIAVWFSSGAASAVAAAETIRRFGDICKIRVVNNPIAEEHHDNERFLRDVEAWIGIEIERAVSDKYPNASAAEVWEKRAYMSGTAGAPCTHELKKVARQQWENRNHFDWLVLGFTSEEKHRHDTFRITERDNLLPVLIDGGIDKQACYTMLVQAGIEPPVVYRLGYPNANCLGCVKASSPTYWNHVRRVHPEVFKARAEQSRRIGSRLARCHPRYLPWCAQDENGKWFDKTAPQISLYRKDGKLESPRVYLDELPADAKGQPMKGIDFECGIFCEEIK